MKDKDYNKIVNKYLQNRLDWRDKLGFCIGMVLGYIQRIGFTIFLFITGIFAIIIGIGLRTYKLCKKCFK